MSARRSFDNWSKASWYRYFRLIVMLSTPPPVRKFCSGVWKFFLSSCMIRWNICHEKIQTRINEWKYTGFELVLIPCNLHENTNSDWLKTAHINILSNQWVCWLEIFFRANYTESLKANSKSVYSFQKQSRFFARVCLPYAFGLVCWKVLWCE